MASMRLPRLPLFEALVAHEPGGTAVVHGADGRAFSYGRLVRDVARRRGELVDGLGGGKGLRGERIAFLAENGFEFVVTLLAVLASHAIAVPMAPSFPATELRYIVNQSQAMMLLSSDKWRSHAESVLSEGLEHSPISAHIEKPAEESSSSADIELVDVSEEEAQGAMMLYTSGTTNRPKGVLLPHYTLTAQCKSLLQAWSYSPSDHLLHVLPLHHIHGTVNALLAPLMAGSTIEFQFPFNATTVWERFAAPFLSDGTNGGPPKPPITFFTVVPTIYNRLLSAFPSLPEPVQAAARTALLPSNLRLNISGSAALPTPTKQAWTALSAGNVLLERYGMTEVGMALSCGLDVADRVDGSVGWPLPGVEARLVESVEPPADGAAPAASAKEELRVIEAGDELDADGRERQGEIQLRGPTVFREYWRNPEATAKEFVDGGDGGAKWFRTGDVAVRRAVEGAGEGASGAWARGPLWFILGRRSADIIKTGGEKVSALEVEREMLALPQVAECAVVAVPSPSWGQKVAAVVVLTEEGRTAGKGGRAWSPLDMRRALKERLVNYKIPQDMKIVESIPRNAMGKINKKTLVKAIFPEAFQE
ncbi:hypothetical protein BDY21DRAFT_387801 [Lineolata rhizophorae]|uniref:Acetyl-CoA synthetase-like protein n=1 Tax=Lineolata rhizophorae TaxID=578093 RepID=A0A6A6NQ79_9PEZI|nr:hypothetical protein BDY21DRAFT_387801 [Lineolata rhizophorae]